MAVWRQTTLVDYLEVSDEGGLRNKHTKLPYELSMTKSGYYSIHVTAHEKYFLHVLIAAAFLGPANGLEVDHKDRNKRNNRLTNLWYRTHAQNCQNRISNNKGVLNNTTRLTENDVKEIRRQCLFGITYAELGRKYKMHPDSVRSAAVGKTWSHIK
jgi:hypothetical protein